MRHRMAWAYVGLIGLLGAAVLQRPDLGAGASFHGTRLLPDNNAWNRDVSKDPVDPNSAVMIASIGADKPLHPDFGTTWKGNPNGIPYVIVDGKQPRVKIEFTEYGDESDAGPYPIPLDAPIEGGPNADGDRHVLAYDHDNQKLYELWHAFPQDNGWKAGCGAVWDLKTGAPRSAGWTSADAAGLPILPGLVRYDEAVELKEIRHALRFTIQKSRRGYVAPASHFASRSNDAKLPPMGMRVRLKASYDTSKLHGSALVIAKALQTYGMIVADNGGDWFLSGSPNAKWNDEELNTLKSIRGRDFEVVKMGNVITR